MKLMQIYEDARNITTIINRLLKTSYSDMTPQDINTGYCADFVDVVSEHMGNSQEIYIMSDEEFWDVDYGKPGDVWSEQNKDGYNLTALSRFNSPIDKEYLKDLQIPSHTWLWYNGKHYDAETPNGSLSIWDMPIFKRALKK